MLELPYEPEDIVLSCNSMERGLSFQLTGVHCCCMATIMGPLLFGNEEIISGRINHADIIKKRQQYFLRLNKNDAAISCHRCGEVHEKRFKDVRFDQVGGCNINIQHYTSCNLKCSFCCYAKTKQLKPSKYPSQRVIDIYNLFKDKGLVVGGSMVQISGGEPALLPDLETLVTGMVSLKLGNVGIFSNCTIHSEAIEKYLSQNDIILITSIDAGIPSTFFKMKGGNIYDVIQTLLKYRETNTKNIWIKYVITNDNRSDDDLYGFVLLMTVLRPNVVYIAPDFPYGDVEIPYESVLFGAKIWYLIKKHSDFPVRLVSDDLPADPKFTKYSTDIRHEYKRLCENEERLFHRTDMQPILQSDGFFRYLKKSFETSIEYDITENKKVALWGFGDVGEALYREIDIVKQNTTVIIDSYKSKEEISATIDINADVKLPEYLIDNPVDVIIIATVLNYKEIEGFIRDNIKYKVKIITHKRVYDFNS
jgi:uncharacterized Fe-S cluster-containing radical SAM superfamily protein